MSAKMILQTFCFPCDESGEDLHLYKNKVFKFTNYRHFIISVKGPVFPVLATSPFQPPTPMELTSSMYTSIARLSEVRL